MALVTSIAQEPVLLAHFLRSLGCPHAIKSAYNPSNGTNVIRIDGHEALYVLEHPEAWQGMAQRIAMECPLAGGDDARYADAQDFAWAV